MFRDNRKKEEKQREKEEYFSKVLGDPQQSLLKDDKAEQKKVLKQEAERLTRLVNELSGSNNITSDCNGLLADALDDLKEEAPDFNKVLASLNKTKQRLLQAYESREAQPEWFPFISLINLAYLAVFVFIIVWFTLVPGQKNMENTAFVCLACALWGGVGGIVDAFFALHTHFSNQDFDKAYWPWYYFHPLLGISMGAVVYLILQAGLLAVSGVPLQETATANATAVSLQNEVTANITAASSEGTGVSKIGVTALPIAIAFLAGFRQRTAVEFFTRIIKAIFQKE